MSHLSVRRRLGSSAADSSCVAVDPLELRRLMAATASLVGSTLRVLGTEDNERLWVVPAKGDATKINAVVGFTVAQTFNLADVTAIEISGLGGNDSIRVYHTLNLPANIRGGGGGDTIWGSSGDDFLAGEKGEDYVYGGPGNDLITGGGQKNHLWGEDGKDKIVGGDGRDFIFGGAGDDRLYGNLGNDDIDGGGNNDRIYGSSDNDLLMGGNGNDRIYGNSEADTLIGGRGRDTLIGGENAGDDVAFADDEDVVSQIEILK